MKRYRRMWFSMNGYIAKPIHVKEIMEALRMANFNLNDASKLLHVHKNTLIYRLDKIRETLNVDPLGNNNDREFVNGFYYYLKRKEQIYQV